MVDLHPDEEDDMMRRRKGIQVESGGARVDSTLIDVQVKGSLNPGNQLIVY